MPYFVGDAAQGSGSVRMRFLAEGQMRDGIALEAIRAALQQDELRLRLSQVRLDLQPLAVKVLVARARRQRQVQLGAAGTARAGLLRGARCPDRGSARLRECRRRARPDRTRSA